MLSSTISFSEWFSWETFINARLTDSRFRNPGVYLVALFETPPTGCGDPKIAQIVYIGETTRQHLKDRLKSFGVSAYQGKTGHSGGLTFHEYLRDGKLPPGIIYLSVMPISTNDERAHPFYITLHERESICLYIQQNYLPPKCNLK
jgi:hypothetical protein